MTLPVRRLALERRVERGEGLVPPGQRVGHVGSGQNEHHQNQQESTGDQTQLPPRHLVRPARAVDVVALVIEHDHITDRTLLHDFSPSLGGGF